MSKDRETKKGFPLLSDSPSSAILFSAFREAEWKNFKILFMTNPEQDWRLQGQESYLFSKKLVFKNYSDRATNSEHDHCEFCSNKFSELIPECLKRGYTTEDDNDFRSR